MSGERDIVRMAGQQFHQLLDRWRAINAIGLLRIGFAFRHLPLPYSRKGNVPEQYDRFILGDVAHVIGDKPQLIVADISHVTPARFAVLVLFCESLPVYIIEHDKMRGSILERMIDRTKGCLERFIGIFVVGRIKV